MDQSSLMHLFEIFLEVLQDEPILKNVLTLIKSLLQNDKRTIFDQLPAVIVLVLEKIRAAEGKLLAKNDGILVQMVSKWMHSLAILLDKDKFFPITNS